MNMDLDFLAWEIKNYEGLTRKRYIGQVIRAFRGEGRLGARTMASFGEDAAVIDTGGRGVSLLATDGIWGRLIKADPWWAGYCAVLVNVNDIASMGGRPVGMVDVLSLSSVRFCRDVSRGLADGMEKFGVPLVGGHLHPDVKYDAVNVAILGEADRDALLYSHTARPGDRIVVAVDLEGRLYPRFQLNWDTTTMKDSERVQGLLRLMERIGKRKLAASCKDISNPGVIGTLGMLFEASGVGGTVDLTRLPRPEGVQLSHWVKVYPGFGFVMTAREGKAQRLIKEFEREGIAAGDVGGVDDTMTLQISDGKEEREVFDLKKEGITGIRDVIELQP